MLEMENFNLAKDLFKNKKDIFKFLNKDCGYFLPGGTHFLCCSRWMRLLLIGKRRALKTSEITSVREPPAMPGLAIQDLADFLVKMGHGLYVPMRHTKSIYTAPIPVPRNWMVNLCANLEFDAYKNYVANVIKDAMRRKKIIRAPNVKLCKDENKVRSPYLDEYM